MLPEETPGESVETAELGQSMGTVLEGTSALSITQKISVEARKRIKAKAKAEEKERKADQGPEATHSHLRALEVLGLALKPERAPGLVGVPLPIPNVRSAETTWLASVPEAKTANGIILPLANITRMETANRGRVASFCTQSAAKLLGSHLLTEGGPLRRPQRARRIPRKMHQGIPKG